MGPSINSKLGNTQLYFSSKPSGSYNFCFCCDSFESSNQLVLFEEDRQRGYKPRVGFKAKRGQKLNACQALQYKGCTVFVYLVHYTMTCRRR